MSHYVAKSKTDVWQTPKYFYEELDKEFNFSHFDPCPLDPEFDGLEIEWAKRTFCNPPYSGLKSTRAKLGWIEKAHIEAQKGKLVVLLIPARVDTTWFHDIIEKNNYEVRFIRGRIKFLDQDGHEQHPAPFPTMLVIMRYIPPPVSSE